MPGVKYAQPTALLASLVCGASAIAATQPGTPKIPVPDTYHGVRVVDDYRWLENGEDPKVKAWSDSQSARARAYLDRLPGTSALRARIEHLLTARPPSIAGLVPRAGKFFAVCLDPARKQQPWIVLLPSPTSTEGMRTLVDPNVLDPTGHTTFDWFVPSPDGSKLAVSLSQGGSEAGTLHVYDVATGVETGDLIPRVQVGTGGGSLAWTSDSRGLWYTRYPHEGERPKEDLDFYQQVFFHTLGTPAAEDRYSMGRELPRIAEISLRASEDGRLHLALVQNGDSGDYAVYFLPDGATTWQTLSTFADGLIEARFGRDGSIWAISKKGAPRRRVLRIPAKNPALAAARTVLDQRANVIEAIETTRSRLYTIEALSGKSRLRAYDLDGNLVEELPTPPVSAAEELRGLDGDSVFYGITSFLTPYAGWVFDPAKKASTPTVVGRPPVADYSDAEVLEESALSKDGTRVPMFILQRKGTKRDGRNPVVLTGYGGFGISQTPGYSDLAHVYTERGVVLVFAILRGGGEFGEEWHDAGRLTKKQNVFDDFLACAAPAHRAEGHEPRQARDRGRLERRPPDGRGVHAGAEAVPRRRLARRHLRHAPRRDFRERRSSTRSEFGTVKVPEQFKALYAYSPYHHVKDKTRYPAILMPTGANDPRVDPMQSRKMIARLQAARPEGDRAPSHERQHRPRRNRSGREGPRLAPHGRRRVPAPRARGAAGE